MPTTKPKWMPTLSLSLLALAAAPARAADTCGSAQAQKEIASVYEGARQRLRKDAEPVTLQKEKIGHVLVARPAPTPTDVDALRADLEQLARTLQATPGAVCQEALRVRRKHGL